MIEPFGTSQEVLDALRRFDAVVVTGPQRSGTTVISQMLASDLGYAYSDEMDHQNNFALISSVASNISGLGMVFQAPALSWCIERLPRLSKLAVVWVLRDPKDIEASQDRIGWSFIKERQELSRYITRWGCTEEERVFDAKLRIWREKQQPKMRVSFAELEYTSEYVQNHSMFLAKSKRAGFGVKQTSNALPHYGAASP